MVVADKLKTTLPVDIDEKSKNDIKKQQTIDALSVSFVKSVRSKHASEGTLINAIQELSIKEINDIFFDDEVPNTSKKGYCVIIDEFLSNPDYYQSHFESIIEGYLQTVIDLQEHIQHLLIEGRTEESSQNYRTSTANYLNTCLTSICERTRLVISIHREIERLQADISTRTSEIDTLGLRVESIGEKADGLDEAIHKGNIEKGGDNPGIEETVRALSQKVNETKITSDQIMPNIISLMGVFSSIIVVILSLIATSSTWLTNANETSVLIAFVVPAGIITLAICALTALVRSMLDTQSIRRCTQPGDSKVQPVRLRLALKLMFHKWGLWLIIVTITSLIVCGTVMFCQDETNNQTHYLVKCVPISEPSKESIDEDTHPTLDEAGHELYIVQEIILPTGKTYLEKIPCSENDKHVDGYVYYCLLHQRFE